MLIECSETWEEIIPTYINITPKDLTSFTFQMKFIESKKK